VTSQLQHAHFQPERVRLEGLGFNKINPVVLWITPSGCRVMLPHLNPVSQPMKTPTKIQDICIIFDF
jgi:hypothetical protein